MRLAERAASLPELFETILLGQDADYEYTVQRASPMEAVKVMTRRQRFRISWSSSVAWAPPDAYTRTPRSPNVGSFTSG